MPAFFSRQTDYFTFVALTVVLFAALARFLPRHRHGAALPRITWLIVPLLLTGGWWLVEQAGRTERQKIETLVSAMAPTYAHELARAGHARITLATPPDDPTLQTIRRLLDDWIKANPIAADIYTMRRAPDGRRIFIVDTDTDYDHDGKIDDHEKGAALGEAFTEEDSGLERAFAGEANFNPEVVHDRWGTWVGSWAPIFDEQGRVEAVVGIDYDATQWLKAIGGARRQRLLLLALLLLSAAASLAAIGVLQASVAERRAAQERHAKAEQRLRLTLQQMPLAFIEIDVAGLITAWNPAAEVMFGYTREEVVGKLNYDAIVAPAARTQVRELLTTLRQQPLPKVNVNENLTRGGSIIRCEWFNGQIIGLDGKIISVVCLAQDVSERHSLEEQVRQSQRMTAIGQLAAGIAHDFNNLLTVIQGHADLVREQPDLTAQVREDLDRICTAGDRAAHLTRQLLTFSRKQAIFTRPIDLCECVRAATHLLERTLGATITVRCEFATGLPHVVADPTMLEQAITNLALNARDAMPAGGLLTFVSQVVEVSLTDARSNPERRAGRFVRLAVSDTGCGIAPEILPRIFEPFFTTKDVGQGTGLGLSAVHGIMKQHGGWVEVRSLVGIGTTFALFFPPTGEVSNDSTSIRLVKAASASSDGTVLLVEDDGAVRHFARSALERSGFHVLDAEDGPSAEQLWSRHKLQIAALLTDMVLPNGVSGPELADRLLAERPDLPVVFISGYSLETTLTGFTESATRVFLQKPYLPEQLVAALQRVLRTKIKSPLDTRPDAVGK
jgi:PAS domain S-box-containing protein